MNERTDQTHDNPGSIDSVAASMLQLVEDDGAQNKSARQQRNDDGGAGQSDNQDDTQDDVVDDDDELEDIDDADSDQDDYEDEEDDAEDGDTDEEDEDDEDDAIQLRDDTVVSVTVDGQEVEVSLADLKRAYAGEGAIEKRLQEVTEAKKQTEELRNTLVQDKKKAETQLNQVVQLIDAFQTHLFAGRQSLPDPELATTDPNRYTQMKAAYDAEQTQIGQKRQAFEAAINHLLTEQQKEIDQAKRANAEKLVEALPDLKDQTKGPVLKKQIVEGAQSYGFTPAEIASAADYRLFVMAADAAAYRRLKEQAKLTKQDNKQDPKKTVKKRAAQQKPPRRVRQSQEALKRAAETGSVDDVAATLLVQQPRRSANRKR